MSVLAKAVSPCGLRLVLPCADKLFFVNVEGDKDTALAFRVSRGYLACPDSSLLQEFLSYIDKHTDRITAVGQLETVISSNGDEDYRQRIVFSDMNLLAKLCQHTGVTVVVPSSFRVGVSQLSACSGAIPYLTKYAEELHEWYSVEDWLTHSCIFQLRVLFGGDSPLFIASEPPKGLLEGLLDRSPYLCPIYDEDHPEASTLICVSPKLTYQGKKLFTSNEGVEVKVNKLVRSLFGYTARNLSSDRKTEKKVVRV